MKRSLIGFYIAIIAVHLLLVFVVIPRFGNPLTPFYNQNKSLGDGYDLVAENLLAGNGYRFYPDTASTLMREPAYPILLAGVFYMFGDSVAVVKLANVLLALATAALIARTARQVTHNELAIFCAPVVFLFHPGTLIAESRRGVEVLFTFVVVLFLLTLYRAIASNNCNHYMISGGVLGLTVLVRSTPILFPLFLFVYLLVFERHKIPKLSLCRNLGLMVIAMLTVLSPWIIRNYFLTGEFVSTASVLGVSAHAGQYIGTHLSPRTSWVDLDREAARERSAIARQLGYEFREGYYQYFYSSRDELEFSRDLTKRVIGEYRRSPMLFVKCAGLNLFNFWFAGKTWKSTIMNVAVELPFLLIAIFGAVLAVNRNGPCRIGPMVLFIVYLVAVSMPILAQARYSVPTVPFLSILSCVAVTALTSPRGAAAARTSEADLAIV